jgi:hypothetical protein
MSEAIINIWRRPRQHFRTRSFVFDAGAASGFPASLRPITNGGG